MDRKTIKQPLNQFVKKIVKTIDPDRIILYGSFARGNASTWSDIDIAVVGSKKLNELETNIKRYFNKVINKLEIAHRLQTKLVLVSRTIADISESKKIQEKHIKSAIDIMGLNDPYFKSF